MENSDIPITIYLDYLKHLIIENYLKNRKQCVEINNVSSTFTNISTGVPQGYILGPLLFIIYMNDIPSTIFKTYIYAYDTTLVANLNNFYLKNDTKLNIKMLNDELNKII